MIITQTPYRVSFAGGGTDLPAFYEREDGAVLSVGVNHHMYVTVSPRFEKTTRIAYTKVEICETIDAIEHTLARETLRITELGPHVEITTVGDVPAGTGMGSSSSLTVGLLQALYAYRGQVTSARKLAEESCRIEIDILKKPIGKQDQYAAAFGGLNYITFHSNGSVSVVNVSASMPATDQNPSPAPSASRPTPAVPSAIATRDAIFAPKLIQASRFLMSSSFASTLAKSAFHSGSVATSFNSCLKSAVPYSPC